MEKTPKTRTTPPPTSAGTPAAARRATDAPAATYGPTAASAQRGAAHAPASHGTVRVMAPVFLAGFIAYAYNNVFMMLTPSFAQEVGADLIQAGLQGTVFSAVAVALRFVLGPLADRMGAKPVMALGIAAFAVAAGLFAVCTSFWQVVTVRCIQAVGLAAFFLCATAAVAAGAPAGRSGFYLGIYRFVTATSLLVGPAAAFAVADTAGTAACFAALGALSCVALATLAALPAQPRTGNHQVTQRRTEGHDALPSLTDNRQVAQGCTDKPRLMASRQQGATAPPHAPARSFPADAPAELPWPSPPQAHHTARAQCPQPPK